MVAIMCARRRTTAANRNHIPYCSSILYYPLYTYSMLSNLYTLGTRGDVNTLPTHTHTRHLSIWTSISALVCHLPRALIMFYYASFTIDFFTQGTNYCASEWEQFKHSLSIYILLLILLIFTNIDFYSHTIINALVKFPHTPWLVQEQGREPTHWGYIIFTAWWKDKAKGHKILIFWINPS